jgi:hypothetical protein
MNANSIATNSVSAPACAADQCPLCGGANACQLCTTTAYKGPCWCLSANIPDELLARVPTELRNRACICAACVADFQQPPVSGEYYFTTDRLKVFTAAFLLQRGYCCGSGCRHCPYPVSK